MNTRSIILKRKLHLACIVSSLLFTPMSAFADDWVLRLDGIGPLKVGMLFDDANKVSGHGLKRTPVNLRASENCDFIPVRKHPGLALMFLDDRLARVDVFGHRNRMQTGIKVGDVVKRVFDQYPNIEIEPHAYEEGENYLTAISGNGNFAVRFETRNGKILRFYAGEIKPVQFIEECL